MCRRPLLALTAAFLVALATLGARAEQVVVPVAIFARGPGDTNWSTEVRATNSTAVPLSFSVIDFVGVLGGFHLQPASFKVDPHQTRAFGAWDLLSTSSTCGLDMEGAYFGSFVIQVDAGLSVQAAVLAGVFPPNSGDIGTCSQEVCPSWQGGYPHQGPNSVRCNNGAGPIFDNDRDFSAAGVPITLLWLHTQDTRRTNLSFYNPDPVDASVALTVTPADGTGAITQAITVPAHGVLQVNNVFSAPPFDAIRVHNGSTTAAASATVVSTTRLYAIGWIIANLNSTVSVSQPR